VLVDSVTYIVCGSAGLDVSGESIPYIAGWGEDGALDAIRQYAETADTTSAPPTRVTPTTRRWRRRAHRGTGRPNRP